MKRPSKLVLSTIYGIDPDISIAHVGTVDDTTIQLIEDNTGSFRAEAWPPELQPKDIRMARKHGYDAMACVTQTGSDPEDKDWDEDFVRFACYDDREKKLVILNHLRAIESLSWMKEWPIDLLGFETWFAHLHTDHHYTRIQINVILDNPLGHRLVSIGKGRKEQMIAPRRGDIIFLDITRQHAVIPNQDHGIAAMKENPLRALAITINESYYFMR